MKHRTMLTAFSAVLLVFAIPTSPLHAAPSVASCLPVGLHAASAGTMVNKVYTTGSVCLTPGVDTAKTLHIQGFSVDALQDDVCVRPELMYKTAKGATSIVFPLNCSGGDVALTAPSVPGVSYAALRVCLLRTSAVSALTCTSPAQFFPPPPPARPFGPR